MSELENKEELATREITMGGIVTSVRRGISKNGNPYGIAKIEDYSGSAELPFWGNDWVTYQGYLNEGTFLFIKARCQPRQWKKDELELKITSMELLPDVNDQLIEKMTISMPLDMVDDTFVNELSAVIKDHPGNVSLCIKVFDGDHSSSVNMMSQQIKISVGKELITYLTDKPELSFHIN
jgi:DNA polymerase-3 subunit alpha